jgi:hypothetical protein
MQGIILAAMLSGAAAGGAPQSADDLRYERIEPSPKQMAKLQALTPEGVAAGADILDDDLETIATITTVSAYQSNGGFTDRVRSDNFLRAFVDKRTGTVRYQLYQTVSYNYVYRNFTGVNYAAPNGPQTASVDVIDHAVIGCAGGPDRCSYKDTLGFDVTEDQLRWVAGQYVAGNSPFWRFKFRSQAGMDWEDRIAPAEAAGVLEAVRRYLIKHGVSGTTHQ